MWCDNCALILPLRAGSMAWAVFIALYSGAGAVLLFLLGQYFFFFYPEWQIYGGIGLGVGALAIINLLALSNRSYIWIRVCKFLWPVVLIITLCRAILMIVQLNRGKEKIVWECNNGGQLWTESSEAGYETSASLPPAFCATGFTSLNLAFIISLCVDIVCQMYMLFLNWRFSSRLEHYSIVPTMPYKHNHY